MRAHPLVHFLSLGALIFVLDIARSSLSQQAPTPEIVLSKATERLLLKEEEQRLGRMLKEEEKEYTLRRWEDETLLVEDARRLGLHIDDPIIRRRLEEKMRYLLEDAAESVVPSDEELEQHLRENSQRFMLPAELSMEQRFFSREVRGAYMDQDAQEALIELRAGKEIAGDPHSLGKRIPFSNSAQLTRGLGRLVANTASELALKTWTGPLASSKGLHLIRVLERKAERTAKLKDVRPYVEASFKAAQRNERLRTELDALRERRGLRQRVKP